MDLATRDMLLEQIERQIIAKREMLLNKQHDLKKTVKQNHFLEAIRDDYKTYYDYIVKEKQDQIHAMETLRQYISDIIISGKLTDHDFEKAKVEQKNILTEINKIKNGLDDLIGAANK